MKPKSLLSTLCLELAAARPGLDDADRAALREANERRVERLRTP